jgi:NitT/TauT family transport system substrate-binding protein
VVVISQVNTEGSALVIAAAKNHINRLADLDGKTVAVPALSSVQDFLIKQTLRRQGLKLEKVKFIVIKPPEMISVLSHGDIDAFIAWEPYPAKAGSMGVGRNLAISREMWADHPCCVLVVGAKFLSTHPEQVKAVLRAHLQATDYIHKHPDKAADIAVKYTGMDKKTIESAMKNVTYTSKLSIEGEKQYVQFLSELGYIPKVNADAFVQKLINQELLQGVAK